MSSIKLCPHFMNALERLEGQAAARRFWWWRSIGTAAADPTPHRCLPRRRSDRFTEFAKILHLFIDS